MDYVVGGGPVGLWAAKNIGRCAVFEEHGRIGRPVQCSGLVSRRIDSILKIPSSLVVNRVKGAKLYAADRSAMISRGREEAYVIDREAFDCHLADLACRAGASIIRKKMDPFKLDGRVIVADGAASLTRKRLGCSVSGLPSLQHTIRAEVEPEFVELHFLEPDFFAWVIPEDAHTSRVGIASKRPRQLLERFVSRRFKNYVIKDSQAGLVLTGGPVTRTAFGNILLVGDAAGQVKATTGGGIVTGMMCAEEAARHVGDPAAYEKAWRAKVGRELEFARRLRQFLSRLSVKDYPLLLGLAERNKDLIAARGDMDFYSRLVRAVVARPSNWPAIIRLALLALL